MNDIISIPILELFYKFLKFNNAYYDFIYYLKNNHFNKYKLHSFYYFSDIDKISIMNVISDAFNWANTKQGHKFWFDLHIKWIKFVNAIEVNITFKMNYVLICNKKNIIKKKIKS